MRSQLWKTWGVASLVLISISFITPEKNIDIPLHDVYFITSSSHIGILISLILGGLGFFYWLLRKTPFVLWLAIAHAILTILSGFLLFVAIFNPTSVAYGVILISTAVYSQVLFVVNTLIGWWRSHA